MITWDFGVYKKIWLWLRILANIQILSHFCEIRVQTKRTIKFVPILRLLDH